MSNSLWLHGLQHTRLPCPSLSPRVCSNSCSLSQWCHPWDSPGKNTRVGCQPPPGDLLNPGIEPTSLASPALVGSIFTTVPPKSDFYCILVHNNCLLKKYLLQGWINQFSLVTQSCLTLWDPMDYSTPGLLVHHQLPEFTQIHAHWVSDAIQPCHPLSSPSPAAFSLSQHQGLFKWVSSSHEVAKVLEFQLQHQSFQWTLRTDLL